MQRKLLFVVNLASYSQFYFCKTKYFLTEFCSSASDLDKKIKEMDEQIKTLRTQMHSLNMTLIKLNDEKDDQELLMRESSSLFAQSDRQFQIVIKDHEYAKNRETELLVDK